LRAGEEEDGEEKELSGTLVTPMPVPATSQPVPTKPKDHVGGLKHWQIGVLNWNKPF